MRVKILIEISRHCSALCSTLRGKRVCVPVWPFSSSSGLCVTESRAGAVCCGGRRGLRCWHMCACIAGRRLRQDGTLCSLWWEMGGLAATMWHLGGRCRKIRWQPERVWARLGRAEPLPRRAKGTGGESGRGNEALSSLFASFSPTEMFIYLSKKIKVAIPNPIPVCAVGWNTEHGWIAVGGDEGLLKVSERREAEVWREGRGWEMIGAVSQ